MRGGNFQANGQPWSKKQRKASRFHNKMRQGGFNATQRKYDVSDGISSGNGGLLAGLVARLLGRRKKV